MDQIQQQISNTQDEIATLNSLFDIERTEWKPRFRRQFPTDEALQQQLASLRTKEEQLRQIQILQQQQQQSQQGICNF